MTGVAGHCLDDRGRTVRERLWDAAAPRRIERYGAALGSVSQVGDAITVDVRLDLLLEILRVLNDPADDETATGAARDVDRCGGSLVGIVLPNTTSTSPHVAENGNASRSIP